MKILKMTKENAERHKSVSEKFIITIRDEEKLSFRDSCYVENYPKIPFRCAAVYSIHKAELKRYWELLGFKSISELEEEINRIYPNREKFVVHALYLLKGKQLEDDAANDRRTMYRLINGYCDEKHSNHNPAMCYGCSIDMIAHNILGASYYIRDDPYHSYIE